MKIMYGKTVYEPYPHCYYVKQKMTWYKKNGLVLKKTSKLASKYKYLGKCYLIGLLAFVDN